MTPQSNDETTSTYTSLFNKLYELVQELHRPPMKMDDHQVAMLLGLTRMLERKILELQSVRL